VSVDTLGLVLAVAVTSAGIDDAVAAPQGVRLFLYDAWKPIFPLLCTSL
jgi:hypothetical protein